MNAKRKPEVIELDAQQLEAQLDQIEQTMGEQYARPFRQLLGWYLSLLNMIERKNTSIARLRRLLFGARTERSRELPRSPESNVHSTGQAADSTTSDADTLRAANTTTDDV